jgi:hypothetical protein
VRVKCARCRTVNVAAHTGEPEVRRG